MSKGLTTEEATAILLDRLGERVDDGESRLPPTAHNKLIHFIKNELDARDVEADLPLFWYMYGPVAVKHGTGVYEEERSGGTGVACEMSVDDATASAVAVREAERAVDKALDLYFKRHLNGLIRLSYQDAPYEVQRVYLEFRNQLESEANEDQATLSDFGSQTGPSVRNVLYDFINEFPASEYRSYKGDLHTWYRLLSAELDADEYDASHALRVTERFWRLFCLELACRENTGVDHDTIEADLPGVEDIDKEKTKIRRWFSRLEQEKTRRNSRHDETVVRAGEALVAPQIGIELY